MKPDNLPSKLSEFNSEIVELADRYCENRLSSDDVQRLEKLLADDQDAMAFLQIVEVHASLYCHLRGAGGSDFLNVLSPDPVALQDRSPCPSPWFSPIVYAVLAVIVVFCVDVSWIVLRHDRLGFQSTGSSKQTDRFSAPIAFLERSEQAEWLNDYEKSPDVGFEFFPESIELVRGFAIIRFASGCRITMEAPTRLNLINEKEAELVEGRVVVRCEKELEDFILTTSKARVIDLGTEFGVASGAKEPTLVQVYEGSVQTELIGNLEWRRELKAGQSVQIDNAKSTSIDIPFDENRFVRRLDARPSGKVLPFNRPNVSELHVVRTNEAIHVDGMLNEWQSVPPLRSACESPYGNDYYVATRLMFDSHRLYISAEVGDPLPMRNQADPRYDGFFAWRGGALQLRMNLDRNIAWPLKAVKPQVRKIRKEEPMPQDTNPKLVHLCMWWYAMEKLPCLQIEKGMDMAEKTANPSGFEGAFRRHPDDSGYILEYAIDWTTLGVADDPPQSGDELAGCLIMHWSDIDGRTWQGHLIDVCNPNEWENVTTFKNHGSTFQRAATWGRFLYIASEE